MKQWVWMYTRVEMDQEAEEFGRETDSVLFAEKWMAEQYAQERRAAEPPPTEPLYEALHSVQRMRINRVTRKPKQETR